MNILLCEDEPGIAEFIQVGLREEGHDIVWTANGQQTLATVFSQTFDLLLLDVMLPDMSGVDVCRQVRLHNASIPILMLTALDAVEDRVKGLRAGADDYLPKPFAFEELLARITALHRRAQMDGGTSLTAGNLTIDPVSRTCYYAGTQVDLTPRQFELLSYFVARPGQALTREAIYRDVWDLPFEPSTNVIDVYVNYVRQALKPTGCDACIESVRAVGYRFIPDPIKVEQ